MAQEDDLRGLRKVMDFIIKYPFIIRNISFSLLH